MLIKIEKRQSSSTYDVYYYNSVYMGEFYQEIDGFYVWEPKFGGGYIAGPVLSELGAKLEELNEPWQKQLDKYYENVECNPKSTM